MYHALVLPILSRRFSTGRIRAYQCGMKPDLVNLSSQTYRKQRCLAVDVVVVGLEEA